jgi:hypothetical protein
MSNKLSAIPALIQVFHAAKARWRFLEFADDVAEDIADRGPEQGEDDDDDDSDENEDQRVLYQTLAFFFRCE